MFEETNIAISPNKVKKMFLNFKILGANTMAQQPILCLAMLVAHLGTGSSLNCPSSDPAPCLYPGKPAEDGSSPCSVLVPRWET